MATSVVFNSDQTQPYAQWQIVDVVFPATINTDYIIQHSLLPVSPEQVNYSVIRKGQIVDVYHDASGTRRPWQDGYIILRANVGNAKASLLLWVAHNQNRPVAL